MERKEVEEVTPKGSMGKEEKCNDRCKGKEGEGRNRRGGGRTESI